VCVCMLCSTSMCWGHDLVGGRLYQIRHHLFGWMSRSPSIDEKLRSTIRTNVLVAIGASTRQDADDFDKRYDAAKNLGKDLSQEELTLLYKFLDGSLGGHDPVWSQDILLLKGNICLSLLYDSGKRPPDGLGLQLKKMIETRSLGMEWRLKCIVSLGSYYHMKWKDDPDRLSNNERKTIEDFLMRLTKERRFASVAIMELNYLSTFFPEIKAAMDLHQGGDKMPK